MWQEEDGRSGDGHGAWTDIALRRSTDDGQTWGPIQAICRNSTLGKDGKRDKALEDTCQQPAPVADNVTGKVPAPCNIYVNLGGLPAVFRPLRTVFPGLGAGFLNLGGKMGRTAKKWGKNGEKWARNGLKRVGVS
eukprot:COSAG04_NODE_2402_length_4203_cov_6.597466_6_plen_135_part_00